MTATASFPFVIEIAEESASIAPPAGLARRDRRHALIPPLRTTRLFVSVLTPSTAASLLRELVGPTALPSAAVVEAALRAAGALEADVPRAPQLAAYIRFTTAAGQRPRVHYARTRDLQEGLDEMAVCLTLGEFAAVLRSDLGPLTV